MTEQSHTVLVVDDSRFVRDTFSRFLANEGFRMIPAPGGAEALEVEPLMPVAAARPGCQAC